MNTEKTPPHHIAGQFANAIKSITPLGNGLINDTFLVTSEAKQFVLQRINRRVFPEPERIAANLLTLNQHIQTQTDARLQMPEILRTATGQANVEDGYGDIWRAQTFIAGTESLEALRSLADAAQVGYALGHFHRLTSTLPPNGLHDTLPGFHITPAYLRHYHAVIAQPSIPPVFRQARHERNHSTTVHPELVEGCDPHFPIRPDPFCANFIKGFAPQAAVLEIAKEQGLLPLRVIHGDPKLNNFLFEPNGNIISLIDLDTVKPGLVHYDIGDCLRSCCHEAINNGFNLEICTAILQSYLSEASAFFTRADVEHLYPAIELLPFELGLRFYTDYLQGNRYFKVTEPEQNLHRATAQFRLCASVMAQRGAIEGLVRDIQAPSSF